ncbi:hypothetical protein BN946_scf184834.g38 [Trametes cinnabarina]|uniref:Major facilitator superfamily (MFS) profile domain-containing protein n=1 Tax=Pycnoporus cinnabarinus TaxID=5643 RepID=A0A060S4B5_PYCCI|nr:hypothetical protein BN946_scf184834.g38 [Trametes cinnabarina]
MTTVIEPAESIRSTDSVTLYENRTENEDDRVALNNAHSDREVDDEDQSPPSSASSVWAKMDLIVLPVTTMMFFLSSLFSFALTVTIIPYSFVNFPTNALQKVGHYVLWNGVSQSDVLEQLIGPKVLLPSMVVLWGAVCAFQGAYPELTGGLSVLFSAVSLASAFSGLLAAAIVKMDGTGGKPGWAWLFILEGTFTVLFGFVAFFLLPNAPTSVPFFTEAEKDLIKRALHEDGIILVGEQDKDYTWTEFGKAFTQPHVILIALCGFFNGATVSGLAYFLPSIVAGLGYSGAEAQLMSVPPFAVTAIFSIASSYLADRYARRGLTIVIFATVAAIGLAVFLASYVDLVRYVSLFLLVPGSFCIAPPLGAWMSNNTAPTIRRATALALLSTTSNVGSIVSAWVLGALSAPPRYTVATSVLLAFQFGILVCAAGNMLWLASENSKREKQRRHVGAEVPVEGAAPRNDSILYVYVM